MKPLSEENLPVRLYYDLVGRVDKARDRSGAACKALDKEIRLLLQSLDNDLLRIKTLEAKREAICECYVIPEVVTSIVEDSDLEKALLADGFRKTEEYAAIQQMISWLSSCGVEMEAGAQAETEIVTGDVTKTVTNGVTEERYLELREQMETHLSEFYYVSFADSLLQQHIWRLEGHIALAAGYRVDSGLSWNITGKAPFTKTDFENLMSALWEKKFVTHTTGKKENAIKALYGVFGLPIPEKPGTNRAKAKAIGTTSDNSLEIFERLKVAHQEYLDASIR